jgi:DNA polymerase-3 subunit gamma/tau
VCKDPQTTELLEVGESIRERYLEQSKNCSVDFLYKALDLASKFDINYKISKNKRLHVELALLQFCNILKKKALN